MGWLDKLMGGAGGGASERAHEMVDAGALLLDVRTVPEFEGGHIDGATHIPLHVLPARMSELDPKRPVVVYCRSGGRSGQAQQLLTSAGFAEVHNLGPMSAW